jgi:hypothetical protein
VPRSKADWIRIIAALRIKADRTDNPDEAATFRAQAKELEAKHCPPPPKAAPKLHVNARYGKTMDDAWRMAGGEYTRDGFSVWLADLTDERDYYGGIPDDTDTTS